MKNQTTVNGALTGTAIGHAPRLEVGWRDARSYIQTRPLTREMYEVC